MAQEHRTDQLTDSETVKQVVAFHGHMCPGLAMGIRAAQAGLERMGPRSGDEEMVAIVETDMCGVDAVQYLTGCTFGKGNLVHQDHGKNAYTFVRRSDGRAVRVSSKPGGLQRPPEFFELFAKVRSRTATAEERQQFWAMQEAGSAHVLSMPLEDLYDVREMHVQPPPPARILASVECAACGEPTAEDHIRRLDNNDLCPPCFQTALAGEARVATPTVRPRG